VRDRGLEFLVKEFPHLSFQIGTAMEGWVAEGEFMVLPVLSTRTRSDGFVTRSTPTPAPLARDRCIVRLVAPW